jgi:CTP synthase
MGKIYQYVIEREFRGEYLGKSAQFVPHLTDAVKELIEKAVRVPVDKTKEEPDVRVIELGGTLGDIENTPYAESQASPFGPNDPRRTSNSIKNSF